MKNILIILLMVFVFSSCSAQAFKYLTVKEGDHNFKPIEPILPFGANVHFFKMDMHLYPSAYWSTDDWTYRAPDGSAQLDRDYFDWNKGPGITRATNANNKTSVMIGWRPLGVVRNAWEVCVYFNNPDGSFNQSRPLILVHPGVVELHLHWEKNKIKYSLVSNSDRLNAGRVDGEYSMRRPRLGYRWTGTWMGGDNNSPGPFGGPAFQDMQMAVRRFKM